MTRMPAAWCALVVAGLVGFAAALAPVPHQTSEESLRSALNAVTRKQRSLSAGAYYGGGELPPPLYEMNKRRPQQVAANAGDEIDDNEETLAFIPAEGTGQLETIGDGYQHLNNKQFSRALMDYLQYNTEQEPPTQSMFRERERIGGHKRNHEERGFISDKDLARLLLDDHHDDVPEDERDYEDYQRAIEAIYDKLGLQRDNVYGGDQLLNQLINKEDEDDIDPKYVRIPQAERRNVNARYPLINPDYKTYVFKRFPVAKRSTKAMNKKRQVTDPKVAQDLGALFGTQSTDTVNHTHDHDHDHEHDHDHTHDHGHDHEHEHDHNHVKADVHAEHVHDASNASSKSKNLKEDPAKVNNKTKERTIDVKKKSVDWSQYFGIDRRKKKAVYSGRPGAQEQDNQYLLQKYYELMAEHLNSPEKDGGEKRDKLQQVDSKLKNMKNMMIEEAVQVGSNNNMDNQEVKDEIMSRLAAAYSLEKLRRALNELSSSARESQKAEAQNNLTANHPSGTSGNKNEYKRNRNNIDEYQEVDEEENCPQIDIIERRCKATEALIGDFREILHVPCVTYHLCNLCEEDGCLKRYALEAGKICEEDDTEQSLWSRKHCIQAATILPGYPPAISPAGALCHTVEGDACLAQFLNRYRQHYVYDNNNNNPYAASTRHRTVYDLASSKR